MVKPVVSTVMTMMGVAVSSAGSTAAQLLRQQRQCTGACRALSSAHLAQRQQRRARIAHQQCGALTSASGAIPESPPEWQPPSQTPDSMPGTIPEYQPPNRPEITPGQGNPTPEFQPPGRIAPPERPAEPQPGTTDPNTRPAPPEIPGRPAQPDNPPDTPYRPDQPVPESDPGAQPDKEK